MLAGIRRVAASGPVIILTHAGLPRIPGMRRPATRTGYSGAGLLGSVERSPSAPAVPGSPSGPSVGAAGAVPSRAAKSSPRVITSRGRPRCQTR